MPEEKEKQLWEERLIAYFHDELEAIERQEIDSWLAECPEHKDIYQEICNVYHAMRWNLQEKTIDIENAKKRLQHTWTKHNIQYKGYVAAVSLFLLFGIGVLLLQDRMMSHDTYTIQSSLAEKRHPQVMLLLSDGSEITLDEPKKVVLASEDSLTVIVDDNKLLHYTNIDKITDTNISRYNTLIVPKSCEYFITLSDGSKIWLGADSHFEYPIVFRGNERSVRLNGEAYFEIVKDSLHPFIVHSGEFQLQVYGTAFNLNTYDKTRIQLALVSGSVGFKSNSSTKERMLLPGQLGEVNVLTGESCTRNVDITQYTSWKDGYIIFENEHLESIMEKLSRWYNIEVFFESENLKKRSFYGNLKRYENLKDFLSYLEKVSDIEFHVQGDIVIVKHKLKPGN